MHPRHIIQNSRAFTLVETLVAIAILMISISGPLAIANKALTASLYAKDQSTASFLAMEEMEIIKNIRNNNSHIDKDTWLNGGLMSCVGADNHCEFSIATPSGYSLQLDKKYSSDCPGPTGCPLYVDSNSYNNTYTNGRNSTIFYRYFYLLPMISNPSSCRNTVGTAVGTECQAVVVVSWNEGTVSNNVTLTDELFSEPP